MRRAAREIGELVARSGYAVRMATGSRGIHLWIPIRREQRFEEVREFAREVAAGDVGAAARRS